MALDKQRIIEEAVALLDERGLDGVTMRNLAVRLDVQAPTLYWHVRNKAALIDELADAILIAQLADLRPPSEEETWRGWLVDVALRLRQALLVHPDGARVVAAAHMSLALADLAELAARGTSDRAVRRAVHRGTRARGAVTTTEPRSDRGLRSGGIRYIASHGGRRDHRLLPAWPYHR